MADEIVTRQCRKCAGDFPLNDFPVHRFKRHGKQVTHILWMCQSCKNLANRNSPHYEKSKPLKALRMRSYRLENPVLFKARKRASHLRNLDDHRRRCRDWVAKNPEKRKLTSKASEHKRREGGWNKDSRAVRSHINDALESYRIGDQYWDVYNSCLIDNPTVDHIVPVSKGGRSDAGNLCVTSMPTNSSKFNDSLIVWMLKRASVIQIHRREVLCTSQLVGQPSSN